MLYACVHSVDLCQDMTRLHPSVSRHLIRHNWSKGSCEDRPGPRRERELYSHSKSSVNTQKKLRTVLYKQERLDDEDASFLCHLMRVVAEKW
jgi:hypothetical protein